MGWHTANMVIGPDCKECRLKYYHARNCSYYHKEYEDDPSCPFFDERQEWIRQAKAFDDCWRD